MEIRQCPAATLRDNVTVNSKIALGALTVGEHQLQRQRDCEMLNRYSYIRSNKQRLSLHFHYSHRGFPHTMFGYPSL